MRRLVFGDEVRFAGFQGYYVAIATIPNTFDLDHWALLHNEPGRAVSVLSARNRNEAKALFLFASPPLAYDYHDVAAQKRLVAAAFAGAGWETPRLLASMGGSSDVYFDAMRQIQMER